MAMTVDSSKCSGCRACQMICALHHFKELNPKKGALQIVPKFPAPGGYQVNFCDQCGVCKDVCPAEAISVENGVHRIDPDLCTGCSDCVSACPQQSITVHTDSIVPNLCDWCGECADYCGTQAIQVVQAA